MKEFEQLLVDCIKRGAGRFDVSRLSSLSPEQWRGFLALAAKHRLVPLLAHRLRRKGVLEAVPSSAQDSLKRAIRDNALRNLGHYADLQLLLRALKPEKIPLILLKGIHLAGAVYENIGLREMNDIDVLARSADLERVAKILAGMGYSPLRPVCAEVSIKTSQDLPRMIKEKHAPFEIHWNLTLPGKSHSMDPGELWERAVGVNFCGCEALALSNEDLLLHLCVHASYHHQFAFGLQPYCDIAETIFRFGASLDWRTVADRAESRGWQRGFCLALEMAEKLAGAGVPPGILEDLRAHEAPESIREAALGQVFTDKIFAVSLPVSMAKLVESGRLFEKFRIFWRRVFPSRAEIAAQYSVPESSARIFPCYFRRFFYLLSRYGSFLKKNRRGDESLKALARRKNLVAGWLEQKGF